MPSEPKYPREHSCRDHCVTCAAHKVQEELDRLLKIMKKIGEIVNPEESVDGK